MATSLSFTRGQSLEQVVFDSATRTATFEADLTDSPQEAAGLVTDGWVNKPDSLSLNVTLTDYPLQKSGGGVGGVAEVGRAARILNQLISVKEAGLVCAVSTPWRDYTSVRIKTITVNEEKPVAGALTFTILFRQSVVADSQTVPLVTKTERKPQASTDKGKKGSEEGDENKKKESYLHKLKKGITKGYNQLFPEGLLK